jgi:predicted RNA-binding protein with PUA-like domain
MATRWLFNSEPGAYSFQDLERDARTVWDGVKNDLALKHLAQVKKRGGEAGECGAMEGH